MREDHRDGPLAAAWRVGLWAVLLGVAACTDSGVSGPGNAGMLPDQPHVSVPPANDMMLPERIRQALAADKSIDAAAVSMSVSNGQVTLDGIVPAEQITRIDAIVSGVAGVRIVINALRAIPAAS